MTPLSPEAYAVIEGRHSDPFRYLGPHVEAGGAVVRVFLPNAVAVTVVDDQGRLSDLSRIHDVISISGTAGATPCGCAATDFGRFSFQA
jgi:1,4-alpha-glucan branching enzyme